MRQVGCIMAMRDGLVLAVRRPDGRWGLPGGYVETGERIIDGARRELLEETGLRTEGRLRGLLSAPTPAGACVTTFWADSVYGRLRSSEEGLAAWVPSDWLVHPDTGAFVTYCRKAFTAASAIQRATVRSSRR